MNNILTNMQTANTVLGIREQINARVGIKDIDKPNTLNDILGIEAGVEPNDQANPVGMRYFGVGVRGMPRVIDEGSGGLVSTAPYIPSALNTELYCHIPMRMMPLANEGNHDLSDYRLREVINIKGIDYVVYWLKLLDFENTSTKVYTIDNANNAVEVDTLGTGTPAIDRHFTADKRITVSREGRCQITGREVAEAIEYGYYDYMVDNAAEPTEVPPVDGMVSEIGFFTGVEYDTGGRMEAVGVSLAIHHTFSAIDMSSINRVIEPPINLINGSAVLSGTQL